MASTAGALFISVLLVSGLIIGAGSFMVSVTDIYGVSTTKSSGWFDQTFSVFAETAEITENIETKMEQPEGYSTDLQDVAVLFWGGTSLLMKVPNIFLAIFNDSINLMGTMMPSWFQSVIQIGFTASLVFILYSILMKWRVN